MNDLISRQAAIDALKDMYHAAEKWGKEATDDVIKARAESCMASLIEMKLRIEKLPSAQPEIIRCKDCKYWQTDDGTFPDFDGRPWHECKCLYMFRAPDGEPARTTADFWCGYGERRKDNGIET